MSTPQEYVLPLMGFGTFIGTENNSDNENISSVKDALLTALKAGCRHIDLAEVYNNLKYVGEALKEAMQPINEGGLGINRKDLWVTMKSDGYSVENIKSYIRILNVDYLDTFMLHHPHVNGSFKSEKSLYQAWQKICSLPEELVRTNGVSNCYPGHLKRLLEICKKYNLQTPFSNEVESNLICPNQDTIAYCQANNIKVIAYSPLGYNFAGHLLNERLLFGAMSNPLITIAEELQATPAQIALAWNMKRGVAVIPKSTNSERIWQNINAFKVIDKLTENHLSQLSAIESQLGALLGAVDGVTGEAQMAKLNSEDLQWQVIPKQSQAASSRFYSANIEKNQELKKPKGPEEYKVNDRNNFS